ncbi:carboxypeptidase-like regulatory domain-containing protein [Salinicoccus roseus]|uniref:carboxypeptidase-like regulatory domain-containing protein n=1 Tax=Salinicoccus roseus TaxID=45670 RepID=UPI0023010A86|nr:carboxypeptidase regulatory-like domain-containing protein [Salinicoccus roseus]
MRKIAYYMAVILFIMLIPVSRVAADTEEEATQENAQEPSAEETVEAPTSESSTEEEGTSEYYEEWTEETYEPVPSQTEESYEYTVPQTEETSEEWTGEAYEYTEDTYEDSVSEPTLEETTEQFMEQTAEPTVEVFTEEVTEVPADEPAAELEPVEAPVEVTVSQSEVTEFSIEGKVMADSRGVEDVTVSLSGAETDEVTTDEEGDFRFSQVPAGEYELEITVPEGYEAEETGKMLTIEDKGKKGLILEVSQKEEIQPEDMDASEEVAAENGKDAPGVNVTLVIIGGVLLMLGLLVYAIRIIRNR